MSYTTKMKPTRLIRQFPRSIYTAALVLLCLLTAGTSRQAAATSPDRAKAFSTPQAAADALIDAAEKFDVSALEQIFGPGGDQIINSGEPARDAEIAKQFAAE